MGAQVADMPTNLEIVSTQTCFDSSPVTLSNPHRPAAPADLIREPSRLHAHEERVIAAGHEHTPGTARLDVQAVWLAVFYDEVAFDQHCFPPSLDGVT